jgi:hypothetical protein
LDHHFWIYQTLDMKITNISQICENDKETGFFKNQKGHWAGPTRQRGPARGLLRLPTARVPDSAGPLD